MKFERTDIEGIVRVSVDRHEDERGSFSRLFCSEAVAEQGLNPTIAQINASANPTRGTLRGLHWQVGEPAETKVVVVERGAVWDVVVDLRQNSRTYLQWRAFELTSATAELLFVPAGCAHGFLTLEDDTHLLYLMGAAYRPADQRGARWDDPLLSIHWPWEPRVISDEDRSHPALRP